MAANVLILEDDEKIAALVAKNLEAAGMSCHVVHDGDAALAFFEKAKPDVAVLDIMVPGINGIELTRRIRAKSNLPILLLTARGSETGFCEGRLKRRRPAVTSPRPPPPAPPSENP